MKKAITIMGVYLLIGCTLFVVSLLGNQNQVLAQQQPPEISDHQTPVQRYVVGLTTLREDEFLVINIHKTNNGSETVSVLCSETITGEEIEDTRRTYNVAAGAGVSEILILPYTFESAVSVVCTIERSVTEFKASANNTIVVVLEVLNPICGAQPVMPPPVNQNLNIPDVSF